MQQATCNLSAQHKLLIIMNASKYYDILYANGLYHDTYIGLKPLEASAGYLS